MSNMYYIWDESELAIAQAALNTLNSDPRLPLTGVNAATGRPDPDAQKTVKWAESVQTFTEGRVGFPRISDSFLTYMQVTEQEKQAWLNAFHSTIAEYDPSWEILTTEEPEG
jgi:hypothetical protein